MDRTNCPQGFLDLSNPLKYILFLLFYVFILASPPFNKKARNLFYNSMKIFRYIHCDLNDIEMKD